MVDKPTEDQSSYKPRRNTIAAIHCKRIQAELRPISSSPKLHIRSEYVCCRCTQLTKLRPASARYLRPMCHLRATCLPILCRLLPIPQTPPILSMPRNPFPATPPILPLPRNSSLVTPADCLDLNQSRLRIPVDSTDSCADPRL